MEPLLRVWPTSDRCRRELSLDRAGKPMHCGCPAYIVIEGSGIPLCRRHAEEMKRVAEVYLKNQRKPR